MTLRKIGSSNQPLPHSGQGWPRDFLNPDVRDESNSIKHGMRIHQGGFQFNVSDVPESTRHLFEGSKYGSMVYLLDKLTDQTNIGVTSRVINWNPIKFQIHALKLISLSEAVIVGFLEVAKQRRRVEYQSSIYHVNSTTLKSRGSTMYFLPRQQSSEGSIQLAYSPFLKMKFEAFSRSRSL